MPNIALDDIINVKVSKAAKTAARVGHNCGLIVGQSARIPVSTRCKAFANLAEMEDYGFLVTDPEYKAAALYFGQLKVPTKVIVAKMAAESATQTATAVVTGSTGITAATVTANTFKDKVEDKDGTYVFSYANSAWTLNGKVVTLTEYGITVTGSAVSGDKVTVTYVSAATAESWVDAITDCRDKNTDWYGVYIANTELTAEDHSAIMAYLDGVRACYFIDSADPAIPTSDTSDVFSTLQGAGYKRCVALYSDTTFAGAAVMGYAMGANTGDAGSSYTLAYKRLNGVTATDLTAEEIGYIKNKGGNCYIRRGGTYSVLEDGIVIDGEWFDEILGVDQLTTDLQRACMDVLTTEGKVPYTDAGTLMFVVACNEACAQAVKTGFLSAGIWNGEDVINVRRGDMLEAGYLVQVDKVADQTAERRASRLCPDIYVCAILAGAIHSLVIKVDVE